MDKTLLSSARLPKVDQSLIKFSHGTTILLLVLGFVLDAWPLVALAATCQLLGATGSPSAPYRLLYEQVFKRGGLIRPRERPDHPEPHHFASLMGGVMDLVGAALLVAGNPLGWVFVAIVFVLANLNVWISLCMGCLMYYQLHRFGVPGFVHAPIRSR